MRRHLLGTIVLGLVLGLGLPLNLWAQTNTCEPGSPAPDRTGLAPLVEKLKNLCRPEGVSFSCTPDQLRKIETDMAAYLKLLKIDASWIVKTRDASRGTLNYTLDTKEDDTSTVDLKNRKRYHIQDELVSMPLSNGKSKSVRVVSRKEIVLALFQHGRQTQLSAENCSADAFKDHVGIRQNTVLWAQRLEWGWPDGVPGSWNETYWNQGTPLPGVAMPDAFLDAFLNQKKYAYGCYAATKMVMIQGILDYYNRVSPNPKALSAVEARLNHGDNDPLVDAEPGQMWSFEHDYDPADGKTPGKVLTIQYGVAAKNFVPGDWNYFLNTDPVSYEKTGYEGSNAVYLGGGRFDDYYNDNNHSFTYREKLDEVHQWRNGVFVRPHDSANIKPIPEKDFETLGKSPASGGHLEDFRVFPYFF